jgi:hypothetical protein
VTDSAPDPRSGPPKPITPGRITTWLVVGGIGVFLVISGITGIIAKG